MDPASSIPPPPVGAVACKRHPGTQTMLRCTRCGDPICPDCMRPAAVGYQCPSCAKGSRQEVIQPGRTIGTAARGASVTAALLLAIGVVYAISVAQGGAASLIDGPPIDVLVKMGANVPALIAAGEYWRLLSSMFLHANLLHLAFNGYALYVIGTVIEAELGRWRYLAIYLVAGLFSSAAVYMFSNVFVPTVGASGAIFALFGVFVAYNYRRRHNPFYAARMRSMAILIAVNLVFTFGVASISRAGHLGGLAAGVVIGLAFDGFGDRVSRTQAFTAAIVGLAVLTVVMVVVRTGQIPPESASIFEFLLSR
jgi:membrane associated rhomboid family serine protease